jgi:hypothetical protein
VAIRVVSYDLNKPGQDYQKLYTAIEALGDYVRPLKSAWFVATDRSVQDVYNLLRPHIDDTDSIFVHSWPSSRMGWLSKTVWKWVSEHE